MPAAQEVVMCPVSPPESFEPCDPAELAPLLERLRRSGPVATSAAFPRGTLLEDGRLDLCKQRIGPAGAAAVANALRDNPHVHALLLGADGIGDDGARAVARLLGANPAVRTAYLGCNDIGPAGVKALVDAVDAGCPLTSLWLKRNPIGDEGASLIAGLLRRNTTLRAIDLVNTELSPDGVSTLCDAFARHNRTVRRVYLGSNGIGPENADHLADVVRHNPTLAGLFLNANRLGDAGCMTLADALRQNRSLRWLGLASNDIGPDSGAALLDAVATHPSLEQLDLGYSAAAPAVGAPPNRLGDAGAASVATMLRINARLAELDVTRNGLSPRGLATIVGALESNRALVRLSVGIPLPRDLAAGLRDLLRRNRATATPPAPDPDVRAIRSVYRS